MGPKATETEGACLGAAQMASFGLLSLVVCLLLLASGLYRLAATLRFRDFFMKELYNLYCARPERVQNFNLLDAGR